MSAESRETVIHLLETFQEREQKIALLKYEIDDMRLLYENDIRFLKQF